MNTPIPSVSNPQRDLLEDSELTFFLDAVGGSSGTYDCGAGNSTCETLDQDERSRVHSQTFAGATEISQIPISPVSSALPAMEPVSTPKFGVFAPSGTRPGRGPRLRGISVLVSCRSEGVEQPYKYWLDLRPGSEFRTIEGDQLFNQFKASIQSVIDKPENTATLRRVGDYGSLRRFPFPEKAYSSRFPRARLKNQNPTRLASFDLAIVLGEIVKQSGIEQPEDGFNFTTAQQQYFEEDQSPTTDKHKSTKEDEETGLRPPRYPGNSQVIIDDIKLTLGKTPSNLLASQWECKPESAISTPMTVASQTKETSSISKKLKEHKARRLTNNRSRSHPPSSNVVKATSSRASQADSTVAQSPQYDAQFLQIPSAIPAISFHHLSSQLHPPSLTSYLQNFDPSEFPNYHPTSSHFDERHYNSGPQASNPGLQSPDMDMYSLGPCYTGEGLDLNQQHPNQHSNAAFSRRSINGIPNAGLGVMSANYFSNPIPYDGLYHPSSQPQNFLPSADFDQGFATNASQIAPSNRFGPNPPGFLVELDSNEPDPNNLQIDYNYSELSYRFPPDRNGTDLGETGDIVSLEYVRDPSSL